ncbi:MAG: NAD-dependent epimerase/dehydratase family protein, partial [Alphaproteobacteria bacterium]|nr:NAD-dependent epimerase/dehydratase family protein [Alphaproteobacteria bacterium]
MIIHGHSKPTIPGRTVVIGAGGFVGSAIVKRLEDQGAPVLGLWRGDADLLKSDAGSRLASHLRDADTVVLVSANAPVKNHAMLVENLQMLEPIIAALRKVHPAHLVYISSDAVYRDSDAPLTEASCADPGSLHGA